jgi:hypothetical protein
MDIVTLIFQSESELHNFVLLINPDFIDSAIDRRLSIPKTDEAVIELAINGFKANLV